MNWLTDPAHDFVKIGPWGPQVLDLTLEQEVEELPVEEDELAKARVKQHLRTEPNGKVAIVHEHERRYKFRQEGLYDVPNNNLTGEPSFVTHVEAENVIGEIIHVKDRAFITVDDHPHCLRAAVTVVEVLREMQAKGYRMPTSVAIALEGEKIHGETVWLSELTLNLPEHAPLTATLEELTKIAFGSYDRHYTEQAFRDIVIHELAHINHGLCKEFEDLKAIDGPWHHSVNFANKIAKTVSAYAMTSSHEFIAEAFVKLYRGETLPPEAMAMYEALEGPEIKP